MRLCSKTITNLQRLADLASRLDDTVLPHQGISVQQCKEYELQQQHITSNKKSTYLTTSVKMALQQDYQAAWLSTLSSEADKCIP